MMASLILLYFGAAVLAESYYFPQSYGTRAYIPYAVFPQQHPAYFAPYFGTYQGYAVKRPVVARVELVSGGDSGVTGELWFKQTPHAVMITGVIQGLSKGKHGFHIHKTGSTDNNCKAAEGHFNPEMKTHGDPHSRDRHAGDLGNILTYSDSLPTEVFIFDRLISLDETADNNILGRAVVVHAGEDDLGQGGDDESLKTGNAGARVACGVIERVEYA